MLTFRTPRWVVVQYVVGQDAATRVDVVVAPVPGVDFINYFRL
jgi:hypothetical protein